MRGVWRPGAIVEAWFELLPAVQVPTTRALLDLVTAVSPQLQPQVRWGNLVCQLAGQNVLAVAPHRRHVHLQFFDGQRLQQRYPMLQGAGPGLRHLQWRHGAAVDAELVRSLVAAALDLALTHRPRRSA